MQGRRDLDRLDPAEVGFVLVVIAEDVELRAVPVARGREAERVTTVLGPGLTPVRQGRLVTARGGAAGQRHSAQVRDRPRAHRRYRRVEVAIARGQAGGAWQGRRARRLVVVDEPVLDLHAAEGGRVEELFPAIAIRRDHCARTLRRGEGGYVQLDRIAVGGDGGAAAYLAAFGHGSPRGGGGDAERPRHTGELPRDVGEEANTIAHGLRGPGHGRLRTRRLGAFGSGFAGGRHPLDRGIGGRKAAWSWRGELLDGLLPPFSGGATAAPAAGVSTPASSTGASTVANAMAARTRATRRKKPASCAPNELPGSEDARYLGESRGGCMSVPPDNSRTQPALARGKGLKSAPRNRNAEVSCLYLYRGRR